jgi:hypothetical protein
LVRTACAAVRLPYHETAHLVLRRGGYVVAAGLDESLTVAPRVLRGHFINLFDAGLPVLEAVTLAPGSRHLLLDLDRPRPDGPSVVASACKVLGAERTGRGSFRFYAEGPETIQAVARVVLPTAPVEVTLDENPMKGDAWTWDARTGCLLLRFTNSATGRWVEIR